MITALVSGWISPGAHRGSFALASLRMEPPFAEGRPTVLAAVDWAVQMHGDQRRASDQAPFVVHPLEVASLLHGRRFDDEVVAAGALHDVVEKTDASIEDVAARFGPRVASIVAAVSEDESIEDYEERKAALRAQVCGAGVEARAVFAADKISKVRELRARAAQDPAALRGRKGQLKLAHYEASLDALRACGDESSLVGQLEFELWSLRALPPQ
jgi:(p)ppGpp synthase/HD superfamily hydrolase